MCTHQAQRLKKFVAKIFEKHQKMPFFKSVPGGCTYSGALQNIFFAHQGHHRTDSMNVSCLESPQWRRSPQNVFRLLKKMGIFENP